MIAAVCCEPPEDEAKIISARPSAQLNALVIPWPLNPAQMYCPRLLPLLPGTAESIGGFGAEEDDLDEVFCDIRASIFPTRGNLSCVNPRIPDHSISTSGGGPFILPPPRTPGLPAPYSAGKRSGR